MPLARISIYLFVFTEFQTVTESKTALNLMKQKYNNQEEALERQQVELESIREQLIKEQEERKKAELRLKENCRLLNDECKLLKKELAKTCNSLEQESKSSIEYKRLKEEVEEELRKDLKITKESLEFLQTDHDLLKESLVKMTK